MAGIEIERKFLVDRLPDALPAGQRIEQGYLAVAEDGVEVRIRRRDGVATLTIKSGPAQVRTEEELAIDPGRFASLWPLTEGRRLTKTRHVLPLPGGLAAELDVYHDDHDGLLVAEVEFPSLDASERFAAPAWLGLEVTGDARYANQQLALRGVPATKPGFHEDFDGAELDTGVWLPHYLPMWSSRAQSAATYALAASELRLTIPPGQGLWCPDDHEPPLRVSGIQSGVWSGPVGSTRGQQPFREGLVVREHQPAHWGWTPHFGRIEVRARMRLSARSMASVWMVGLEDEPERSGEICVFEVFGDALLPDGGTPTAAVGTGIHPFRDPALSDDFQASRMAIDVEQPHVYAADWRPGRVDFTIDGRPVRSVDQAPDYPMQMMVAVFDFPEMAVPGEPVHVPQLAVDAFRGPASG